MTSPYWPCHRCEVFAAVLPSSGHFLSAAPRCWSTFVYRTTGLRAVGDFVSQVLQTLVGHTLTFLRSIGLCSASPNLFCTSGGPLLPFGWHRVSRAVSGYYQGLLRSRGLRNLPWPCPLKCLYYSTGFLICQGIFSIFLKRFDFTYIRLCA